MDCLVLIVVTWQMMTHQIFMPMLASPQQSIITPVCMTQMIWYPDQDRVFEVNEDEFERIWRASVVRLNGWSYVQTGIWSDVYKPFLMPYEDQFFVVTHYPSGHWVWLEYTEEPTVYDE